VGGGSVVKGKNMAKKKKVEEKKIAGVFNITVLGKTANGVFL